MRCGAGADDLSEEQRPTLALTAVAILEADYAAAQHNVADSRPDASPREQLQHNEN